MTFVLDASAFLRYTDDEPGADRVEAVFKTARSGKAAVVISAANWSEVSHVFHKRLGTRASNLVLESFTQLPLRIAVVDERCSSEASLLRYEHNIPFADSFAAALARIIAGTLLTADFDFKQISDIGAVQVEFFPTKK